MHKNPSHNRGLAGIGKKISKEYPTLLSLKTLCAIIFLMKVLVINCMLKNKKLVLMLVLLIFLVGCRGVVSDDEKINVSEMIEKGKAEIAGNSYDMHIDSVISYKYDGENLVKRSDESINGSKKHIYFYDEDLLSKIEIYSHDRLIAMTFYTYDNNGREIKRETIIEKTKEKSYYITSYEENYKEVSFYNSNDELSGVYNYKLNDKQQVIKSIPKSNDSNSEYETYHEYEDDKRIFTQFTSDRGVTRETYFKYNEYGDRVSVITISFGDINRLDAMYYDNEYDDLKLLKQTAYEVHAEIDENETRDIVKSLK